jgi:hypothetical protein
VLRKTLLIAPIALVALALSGCVWAVEFPTDGNPVYYVTQGVTNTTIGDCSSKNPGDARARALCVLDEVGVICPTQQLSNGRKADAATCRKLSDHSNSADMQTTIRDVLASSPGKPQCLTYWYSWSATPCVS